MHNNEKWFLNRIEKEMCKYYDKYQKISPRYIYIKDSLEAMNMTASEFSLRTGISKRVLSYLINGNSSITFEIASKLSAYFGSSVNYWTNLQNSYDPYESKSFNF